MSRIKGLQRSFGLSVLLVHVDVEDVVKPLGDIGKAALTNGVAMVCAWSHEVRWRGRARKRACLDIKVLIAAPVS